MKRLFLITLCALCLTTFANAQNRATVTATLLDKQNNDPILGAVVEYAPIKTPMLKKHTTSGAAGIISFGSLSYGEYTLKITYLGYSNLEQTMVINAAKVDLGKLLIEQKATQIDDVILEVQSMRTTQKGDTLIYNAAAFKVAKDADTEGLLSKMPGVTITDTGVEAQGEAVKRVYVDGKEFFGNDVTSAIKNLPAEVVDKIEVYNKLSDQAEFTGIDDGDGYKAINIVTKQDMRSGQFGKIYGGYGIKDKYVGGGNINVFSGDSRVSFIGLINNLNQQNFSSEDILGVTGSSRGMSSRGGSSMRHSDSGAGNFMVGQQSGISKVGSLGVNYSDKWGEKVDFSGSYFFNTNKNNNESNTDRQYYSSTDIARQYNSLSESDSRNFNHRLNAKIDYRINENNSLMIRPSVSLQNYSSNNGSLGVNSSVESSLSTLINSIARSSDSKSTGYNISNSVLYRTKFAKLGRTLTFEANGQFSKNDRTSNSESNTENFAPPSQVLVSQYILNNSNSYRLDGGLTYTEPLTAESQLSFQYRLSYSYSDADKKSYDPLYDQLQPELSNVYNSGYLRHRVGPGYRLGNKKIMLSANLYYQRSSLLGEGEYPTTFDSKYYFDNVLYFAMMNYTFTPTNTLRFSLRSSTDNPSVTQLQDVVDISNPQFVTMGNSSLRPTYSHSVFANYVKSSVDKGRTFMVMMSASTRSNYIGDQTTIYGADAPEIGGVQLQANSQLSRPVNMNGYWNVRGGLSFGTPIKPIKSNLNMNVSATYTEAPSIINGLTNKSSGQYYNAGLILGSNINENIDFTFSYNGGYNLVKNSIQSKNDNTYFTQSASGRIKLVMWAGLTFTGNVSYTNYHGISSSFNEEYLICNAYLGKKVFKNQRGEVNVGVNDILNQNRSFSRNVTDTYIENVTNNAIGRYVGVQFIYNLRNFGKKSSSSRGSYDDSPRMPGMPMGGAPGGGISGHGGGSGAPSGGGGGFH